MFEIDTGQMVRKFKITSLSALKIRPYSIKAKKSIEYLFIFVNSVFQNVFKNSF